MHPVRNTGSSQDLGQVDKQRHVVDCTPMSQRGPFETTSELYHKAVIVFEQALTDMQKDKHTFTHVLSAL